MALNCLAGAGKAKTDILASKGIREEPYTGGMEIKEIMSGMLRKKKQAGTRTEIPIKPLTAGTEQVKENQAERSTLPAVGEDQTSKIKTNA